MNAATITTTHGTYTGQTVESIIRREYGHNARFELSTDSSDPHAGKITRQVDQESRMVLDSVISFEGRSTTVEERDARAAEMAEAFNNHF